MHYGGNIHGFPTNLQAIKSQRNKASPPYPIMHTLARAFVRSSRAQTLQGKRRDGHAHRRRWCQVRARDIDILGGPRRQYLNRPDGVVVHQPRRRLLKGTTRRTHVDPSTGYRTTDTAGVR